MYIYDRKRGRGSSFIRILLLEFYTVWNYMLTSGGKLWQASVSGDAVEVVDQFLYAII